jgi:hypothetical protein
MATLRELAAVHEAGHVLAALANGSQVGPVSIGPRGGGVTRIRSSYLARTSVNAYALQRLSGAAAEAVLLGLGHLGFSEVSRRCEGAAVDFSRARARVGLGADAFLAREWPRVVAFVRRRWGAVEALASALEREGTIDGSRALEIVRAASGDERGQTRRIDGQFRAQFR